MKDRSKLKVYEFDAKLKKHENLDAAFVEFPYDVEREFGTRGQVKILVRFDGSSRARFFSLLLFF